MARVQENAQLLIESFNMTHIDTKYWFHRYQDYEDGIGFDPPKHPIFSVFISTRSKYMDWIFNDKIFLYHKSTRYPLANKRIAEKICSTQKEAIDKNKIIRLFLYDNTDKNLYYSDVYVRDFINEEHFELVKLSNKM